MVVCDGVDEVRRGRQHHAETVKKYEGLIMAVVHKYPGESRHETALRHIRSAEEFHGGEGSEARKGVARDNG